MLIKGAEEAFGEDTGRRRVLLRAGVGGMDATTRFLGREDWTRLRRLTPRRRAQRKLLRYGRISATKLRTRCMDDVSEHLLLRIVQSRDERIFRFSRPVQMIIYGFLGVLQ